MCTHYTFKPVYFLASISERWMEGSEIKSGDFGFEWMMNGESGAGGRSGTDSGDKGSQGMDENRSEANLSNGNRKGWKMVSEDPDVISGEYQQQAVTESKSAAERMEEDEFGLGDGETGDGNILWKPIGTDEGELTDDV